MMSSACLQIFGGDWESDVTKIERDEEGERDGKKSRWRLPRVFVPSSFSPVFSVFFQNTFLVLFLCLCVSFGLVITSLDSKNTRG